MVRWGFRFDPLEGGVSCALGGPNAMSIMALADPTMQLNLDEERRIIEESLDTSQRVQVRYVAPATADNLLGGLEQVHLFHFAGHGDFIERPTPGVTVGKAKG